IPSSANPHGDVVDAEVLDSETSHHLAPGDGCRHAGTWMGAQRVYAGERAAPGVLVVVDQDPALRALRETVLGGHEGRMTAGDLHGDRLGELPHLPLRRAADD